jgi:hypothetical protein
MRVHHQFSVLSVPSVTTSVAAPLQDKPHPGGAVRSPPATKSAPVPASLRADAARLNGHRVHRRVGVRRK